MTTSINRTHFLLTAVRDSANWPLYLEGLSQMFSKTAALPQTETNRFAPRSAHIIHRVGTFSLTRKHPHVLHLFACSGILFNHESVQRRHEFATRKLTSGVAAS